jgi:four helix bundle protein
MSEGYIKLGDVFVYKIAIELCDLGWEVYSGLDWQMKKVIGDQFIRAIDSVAANIAEGYGRYHYLDKIKFYYNARASLLETKHWSYLLYKRSIITKEQFNIFLNQTNNIHYHLNKLIQSCYSAKTNAN